MKNFIKLLAFLILVSCKEDTKKRYTVIKKDHQFDCYASHDADRILLSILDSISLKSSSKSFQLNENYIEYYKILDTNEYYIKINSNLPPVKKVYIINKDTVSEVLCYDTGAEFISDTIFDVNGDFLKDIIVNYRMGGNIFTKVFLQNNKGNFIQEITFFNPKFDVKNESITGFINHQSEHNIKYKFKWKAQYRIDTIYFKE
ncbi:hypothetical protein KRX57_08545 [Weeksellaceae bacterium TAE3-ERU29]|nr:hypothetical protein [Weeksellaceae bacterium TAE3-ERU29]